MDSRLTLTLFAFPILVGLLGCATEVRDYKPKDMVRLTPAEVQPLVQQGEALLVCAYDSDQKFEGVRLEGAMPLSKFEAQLPNLAKDEALVFY